MDYIEPPRYLQFIFISCKIILDYLLAKKALIDSGYLHHGYLIVA
jgi:hypothetical protein